MTKLNPIQIWELQDLALAEINRLYKSLDKPSYRTITFSKIKNLEKAVKTLDEMAQIAIREEDEVNA